MRASSTGSSDGIAARQPLVAFAAAMARGRHRAAARALDRLRRARRPRAEAEETALMLVLHAGYPAALEGLELLNRRWPGAPLPLREGGPAAWRRRGRRLCRRVYGDAYPKLMRRVAGLHPSLAVWMVEQGYGRVLSRPRLDERARELVAVAVLAAGGWERQLVSHLRGAARLGCEPAAVRAAVRAGVRYAPPRAQVAIRRAWRAVFGTS